METIEKDLNAAKSDYKTLMDRDVPAFNRSIGRAITPLTGGSSNDNTAEHSIVSGLSRTCHDV